MTRLFALLCWLALAPAALHAQMERTIYQVFEVDSIKTVDLDLAGIYEIHAWAGSNILVETNIKIWHASPDILGFLIEKGRYDVVADSATATATALTIRTKDRERKPLKTPAGDCTEIATAKIFVPDTFVWTEDKKRLNRKDN